MNRTGNTNSETLALVWRPEIHQVQFQSKHVQNEIEFLRRAGVMLAEREREKNTRENECENGEKRETGIVFLKGQAVSLS